MHIVVQWPRFGPYHRARLAAAHAHYAPQGVRLTALATASEDALYDWAGEDVAGAFAHETLFPGRVFDDVAPGDLHRAMTAALDRLQPDAVGIHSYSLPDARAALMWCRRNRRTAVLMNDSSEGNAARIGWREAVKRAIASSYDAALVAGHPQGRYAVRLGLVPERVFMGYDVVDNAYFASTAAHSEADDLPGLADPSPFFLASARFMERKDLPTLLCAYGAYRSGQDAPWRLVLLGDGALRPELEALVARERISGVEMPGWRQLEDLPAYYARAGAFVHTATVDQWGLVVNEAMAAGLPVLVSTGAGCAEDLVRDGENGFTFAAGDASALARHLTVIARHIDLDAFGARSAAIVAEWPIERFATGLLDAARAGAATSSRGLSISAQVVLTALRLLARSPRMFHSVQD